MIQISPLPPLNRANKIQSPNVHHLLLIQSSSTPLSRIKKKPL